MNTYLVHLLILIGIYLILALSFQLSFGYSGFLNFSHISFFGIGAYVYALLNLYGLSSITCFLLSGIVPATFGYLLSISTNKLKGDYLILISLGFSFVVYTILLNWTGLTRGSLGLSTIPRPIILGFNFSSNISFLILVSIFSLLSYLFLSHITKSSFGLALSATRDDELTARSLGKNTCKIKKTSLIIATFFAGIAGSLFASYITFISPSSFTFATLIPIILMVIIGGIASLRGTLLATILIILLPEIFRFISLPSEILGPVRQIFYALTLILIIYLKPLGFYGKINLK